MINAILGSLAGLINVLIIIILIWIMFSILGVFMFHGKLGYCLMTPYEMENNYYYGINELTCIDMGYTWEVRDTNFDHVGQGLITLFILSTLESWPRIYEYLKDCDLKTNGPSPNISSVYASSFCICFICLGSFFFMNLFVGVLFNEYNR